MKPDPNALLQEIADHTQDSGESLERIERHLAVPQAAPVVKVAPANVVNNYTPPPVHVAAATTTVNVPPPKPVAWEFVITERDEYHHILKFIATPMTHE